MRRAAVQAFRVARRSPYRKLFAYRAIPISSLARNISTRPATQRDGPTHVVHTSMFGRSFSVAAFVSVLASGYWFYQKDYTPDQRAFASTTSISSSGSIATATDRPSLPNYSSPASPTTDLTVAPAEQTVANPDFYVSELSREQSLGKKTEEQEYHMNTLSPEQATQKLRRTEESYLVGRGTGVTRYDLVQVASNNPIEDDHSEKIVSVDQTVAPSLDGSDSDWMFWGVFDGHSGWTTSAKLRQVLISYVARELDTTYKSAIATSNLSLPTPEAIDEAIKRGFLNLDNEIVYKSVEKTLSKSTKLASTELLAPALSGACALLSFYDSRTKLLRVACTGDSRAVLGRKGPSDKWTATALSEDQTGSTPFEIQRLRTQHPGEEFVTHKGRILGQLEPSRAFGDASYKWSREIQLKVKQFFFGRTPSPLLKSPPYVTAEPVITTTKVEPEKGDFVILATDGLWEMLTNEEAVGLVGKWMEKQQPGVAKGSWTSSLFGNKNLPVEKQTADPTSQENEGQRAPIRQLQYDILQKDERFVVEDENVATHLVRNALGGRDRDLVCALLSLVSPNSRRYR